MHWILALRRRNERGAAVVEFALVMPLLLTILFGLITTGMAFSDHLSATNATREGARYGAAAPFTVAAADTWAESVRERVKEVYFNAGETVTDDQICVRLVKSDASTVGSWTGANCGTAPTLPTMAAGSCAVVVWMQRPRTIRLLVIPDLDLDIGAETVAFYGREVSPTCTAS